MTSLEAKIGQMFLVGFEGLEPPPYILDWLAQGRIGGVILFARNIDTPEQVARLTQQCHAATTQPILISIDQEGGDIARLRDGFTESPGAMALGAAHDSQLAEQVAGVLATEMHALGINWDYAPVVDISYSRANPAVGTRSLGADPRLVGQLAAAQVKGFQDRGVVACAKHFPGLGNTHIDTHHALATLDSSVEHLIEHDLEPYRAVIAAGVGSIMTTHTIFSALDNQQPVTLSPIVIHRLLREELGYQGVVTTDCMEMKAITDHYPPHESAVLAALASVDLILVSHTRAAQESAYEGLLAAVHSGRVPMSVVDAAYERIQAMKRRFTVTTSPDLQQIRQPDHLTLAQHAARAGTTLLKADPHFFPLSAHPHLQAGIVEFASYLDSHVFEYGGLTGFGKIIHAKAPHLEIAVLRSDMPSKESLDHAMRLAVESHVVVLVTRNAHRNPEQLEIAREILNLAQQVILICLRDPYDVSLLHGAKTILCTCGSSTPSMEAAAAALFGEFVPTGTLPVTVELDVHS